MKPFNHPIFIIALGFVAGFIDVFGFLSYSRLLPAHVTGNVVFLALSLAHHDHSIIMKIAALPIFCLALGASAWFIGFLSEHHRHPLIPALLLEAALLTGCLLAGILLPPASQPNDLLVFIGGSFALSAMALQNTTMRLILNNLPPTTVLTGSLTQILTDSVAYFFRFPSIRHTDSAELILSHQARRMLLTVVAFFIGALAASLSFLHFPHSTPLFLLLPITALLLLLPFSSPKTL